MRPTPITRRNGFTILELLIVFVVFGLVVMISIRSVGDTIRRDKTAKAANILGSDIEQAFAVAARQRMPVWLILNESNRTLSIMDWDTTGTTKKVYRRRSFAKTADWGVDTVYANRDTVIIMPNGIATNPMNITLQIASRGGGTYTKKVSVSTGGMVMVNNR